MPRPILIRKIDYRLVEVLAKLGLTDDQISEALGISRKTFFNYRKKDKKLENALLAGKEAPNRKVEGSLYKRAIGYNYVEKKYRVTADGKELIEESLKHMPGDVKAQEMWLVNRDSERWTRKSTIDLKGELTMKDKSQIARNMLNGGDK